MSTILWQRHMVINILVGILCNTRIDAPEHLHALSLKLNLTSGARYIFQEIGTI